MVSRIRKHSPASLIVTVALALLSPQAARADMEVTLQEDGGPITTIVNPIDFDSIGYNATFGDFKIVFFGATADNLASPGSDLMSSTTSVKNTDATTAHTLTIGITQTDYTLPGTVGTLLTMTSHIGGTVTQGGAGQKLTFQSYAANSNLDFDTSGVTTGPQSPNISTSKTSFDSSPDPTAAFPRTSTEYSVTTYNSITLAPNGVINFSTTTTLENLSTPAPAGFILALTALPALGMGRWLRRRAS